MQARISQHPGYPEDSFPLCSLSNLPIWAVRMVFMLEPFGVSKRHPDSNFKRQERAFMSWAVL